MLFYERADALEPVTMMDEITASAPQEAASQAVGVPVSAVPQTPKAAEARTSPNQHPALLFLFLLRPCLVPHCMFPCETLVYLTGCQIRFVTPSLSQRSSTLPSLAFLLDTMHCLSLDLL